MPVLFEEKVYKDGIRESYYVVRALENEASKGRRKKGLTDAAEAIIDLLADAEKREKDHAKVATPQSE